MSVGAGLPALGPQAMSVGAGLPALGPQAHAQR